VKEEKGRQLRRPYAKKTLMKQKGRNYRLQLNMPDEEYRAVEDFWFRERLPTRAAAVRELLRRGLIRAKERKFKLRDLPKTA